MGGMRWGVVWGVVFALESMGIPNGYADTQEGCEAAIENTLKTIIFPQSKDCIYKNPAKFAELIQETAVGSYIGDYLYKCGADGNINAYSTEYSSFSGCSLWWGGETDALENVMKKYAGEGGLEAAYPELKGKVPLLQQGCYPEYVGGISHWKCPNGISLNASFEHQGEKFQAPTYQDALEELKLLVKEERKKYLEEKKEKTVEEKKAVNPEGQYFCFPKKETHYTDDFVKIITGISTAVAITADPLLTYINERKRIKVDEKFVKNQYRIARMNTELGWPTYGKNGYNIDSGMSVDALYNSGMDTSGWGIGTKYIVDANGRRMPVSTHDAGIDIEGGRRQGVGDILNTIQGLTNARIELSARGPGSQGYDDYSLAMLRGHGQYPSGMDQDLMRYSGSVQIDPLTGQYIRRSKGNGIMMNDGGIPGVDIYGQTTYDSQRVEYEMMIRQRQLEQLQTRRQEELSRAQMELERMRQAQARAYAQNQIRMEFQGTLGQRQAQWEKEKVELLRAYEYRLQMIASGQISVDSQTQYPSVLTHDPRQRPTGDLYGPGTVEQKLLEQSTEDTHSHDHRDVPNLDDLLRK